MKILLAAILALTTTAAHAGRYFAEGSLGQQSSIEIKGFDPIYFEPIWTLDFETDGQSIHFDQLRFEYEGRIDVPNHASVYFDVNISATMPVSDFDVNPVPGEETWQMSQWKFPSIKVTGTYHSFDFVNEIDTEVHASPIYGKYKPKFDFSQYPEQVDIFESGWTSQDRNKSRDLSGLFELEPLLPVTVIDIVIDRDARLPGPTHEVVPSPVGDFDEDLSTDGADFLQWQRGYTGDYGRGALANWEGNYTNQVSAALAAVPEPSAIALACLALLCVGLQRK